MTTVVLVARRSPKLSYLSDLTQAGSGAIAFLYPTLSEVLNDGFHDGTQPTPGVAVLKFGE